METYEFDHQCAYCGKQLTHASQINREDYGHGPADGDAAICIKCGNISVFENLKLRKPTLIELIEIDEDENITAQRQAWAQMVKETGGVP